MFIERVTSDISFYLIIHSFILFFLSYLLKKNWGVRGGVRPPLKKSLFPVQRVAKIRTSREAGISFFLDTFFFYNKRHGKY